MNKLEEQPAECEFEPLISALIDGELSQEAKSNVTAHLANCEACRALHDSFRSVDSVVYFSDESVSQLKSNASSCEVATAPIPKSTSRFVPLAVAATLLFCVSVIFVQEQPAKANPVSPEQVAQPMSDLHLINQQQRRDQELMLRVLGMDLRALKLEISHLPADSEERTNLTDQVNAMLEKVRTFKTETDISINLD